MTKSLIAKLDVMAKNDLGDELLAIAFTIEQSLISAGAVPGKDYSILDVYKLAQPFAVNLFETRDTIEYSYPAEKVR